MSIILPFPEEPLLLAYHNKAFPVGVIQANSKANITLWLALKTVNCMFNTQAFRNKFELCLNDPWGIKANIIEQQGVNLRKETFRSLNIDFIEFFKSMIRSGAYITGSFNERFISGKADYQVRDFDHDYLLIGSDDGGFYSAGYIKTGRFEKFYISNGELIDGLKNTTKNNKISFNLLNYNDNAELKIEYDKFLIDLDQYLTNPFISLNDETNSKYYGIAAIRRLNKYFFEEIENGFVYIDKRYSKSLEEHKKMMCISVSYFSEFTSNKSFYVSQSQKAYNLARIIHRLGFKITFVKDKTIYERINYYFREMIEIELRYLSELKDELEKRSFAE